MTGERRWSLVFLFLSVLALNPDLGLALEKTQMFTGKAFNGRGALEYIERHDLTYEGGDVIRSRTTYFDPDDRVIGYLLSEYASTPQFCNYTFTDLRNEYKDGVRLAADQVCLFRKERPEAEEETACLPREKTQIIGQGFHHFIAEHLEALAEGAVFHVKLAMPSRLGQFRFRILKKSIEGNNLFIRLEIDNWLIRLFAPHVDVVYDRQSGRLLRYEGISNVADASGRFKKVQIHYSY
jgi:hypothetical protein